MLIMPFDGCNPALIALTRDSLDEDYTYRPFCYNWSQTAISALSIQDKPTKPLNLPAEIHLLIAQYLEMKDVISMSQVCKSFRNVYQPWSFKNVAIVDRTRDTKYDFSNRQIRLIPLNAFYHPEKFSWFLPSQVESMVIAFLPAVDLPTEYDDYESVGFNNIVSALRKKNIHARFPNMKFFKYDDSYLTTHTANKKGFTVRYYLSLLMNTFWRTADEKKKIKANISKLKTLAAFVLSLTTMPEVQTSFCIDSFELYHIMKIWHYESTYEYSLRNLTELNIDISDCPLGYPSGMSKYEVYVLLARNLRNMDRLESFSFFPLYDITTKYYKSITKSLSTLKNLNSVELVHYYHQSLSTIEAMENIDPDIETGKVRIVFLDTNSHGLDKFELPQITHLHIGTLSGLFPVSILSILNSLMLPRLKYLANKIDYKFEELIAGIGLPPIPEFLTTLVWYNNSVKTIPCFIWYLHKLRFLKTLSINEFSLALLENQFEKYLINHNDCISERIKLLSISWDTYGKRLSTDYEPRKPEFPETKYQVLARNMAKCPRGYLSEGLDIFSSARSDTNKLPFNPISLSHCFWECAYDAIKKLKNLKVLKLQDFTISKKTPYREWYSKMNVVSSPAFHQLIQGHKALKTVEFPAFEYTTAGRIVHGAWLYDEVEVFRPYTVSKPVVHEHVFKTLPNHILMKNVVDIEGMKMKNSWEPYAVDRRVHLHFLPD